ncbi:MAG: hypothetical protein CVU86_00640 [Firmicutes bacterium HGW-Firmicutes-11]|jgi:uncharacterized membrane protein YczE|nr:MAG: hypothetical protein CVU86_00640 [Firmicutes bacterium HGW-Firmicutes-11]
MNKARRISFVILGGVISGIAISLYLLSGFGPDPFTVLADGSSQAIGVSVGTANLALSFLVVVVGFFLGRKFLGIATVINFIIISPSIDIFMRVFDSMVNPDSSLLIRIVFFVLAYFMLSLGTALYLSTDLGISVVDLTPVMVSKKTHIQYRWCKIAFDVVVVISGFLLGGAFGVGTVFAALATGPLIHWLRKRLKPPLERFFNKET